MGSNEHFYHSEKIVALRVDLGRASFKEHSTILIVSYRPPAALNKKKSLSELLKYYAILSYSIANFNT